MGVFRQILGKLLIQYNKFRKSLAAVVAFAFQL